MSTAATPAPPAANGPSAWHVAAAIVATITLIRIVTLYLSPINLGGDEAQYWDWSRTFAFGYFSKPPLIAWIIGATTAVCGNGEACVRISAPLLHAGSSIALFFLAKRMFDAKIGVWTAVTFCLLPGISFSSGIITTDVPLLFFWSLSLLAFHIALSKDDLKWDVILGICIGFGFLSKYAMVYFLVGMALVILFSRSAHTFARTQKALITLGIVGLFLVPNIIWNLQNEFSTVSHTAANANWSNSAFRLENILDFLGDQMALFGPILFTALLAVIGAIIYHFAKSRRHHIDDRHLVLLAFILPPLLIVISQSFISRAHGNWAAVAYPAATVLVVHVLIQGWKRYVLYTATAVHAIFALGFYVLATNLSLIDQLNLDNAFKRVRGWPELVDIVSETSRDNALYTLLFDDRMVLTEYLYYGRPDRTNHETNAFIWDQDGHPGNHYELTRALKEPTREPLLLVSRDETPDNILPAFDHVEFLKEVEVSKGDDRKRRVYLYIVHGFPGHNASTPGHSGG